MNVALASAGAALILNAGLDSAILAKLPTGYATEAAGKGKSVWSNRRVQVLGAATIAVGVWGGRSLTSRLALMTLAGLLGSAVRNHKSQYQGAEGLGIREVYQ